jgi:pimeloyl-ACP methyl ester carboxylesterase
MRRTLLCVTRLGLLVLAISMSDSPQANADEPSFDPGKFPPPGKLVDLGGWRLHLHCTGEGEPTVVFVSGGGDFSFDWSLVQPEVARFTRACAYDRAGAAWSDPGPTPRTMKQEVYELHTLLHKAGVDEPYVLVGHSYGGLLVRLYAERYPDELAGMVLVDALHEDAVLGHNGKLVRMREIATGKPVPAVQPTMVDPPRPPSPEELKQFEDFRKFTKADEIHPPFVKLPNPVQQVRLWARSRPPVHTGEEYLAEEMAEMYAGREARQHQLGDKPLVILIPAKREGAGSPPPGVSAEEWKRLYEEKTRQKEGLVRLSRNSKLIVAQQSGHHIMLDEPSVLVEAIREVVVAARDRTRLNSSDTKAR